MCGWSLQALNQFMGGVAIATQCNPEISSLVIGGLRLILDVGLVGYSAWHYHSLPVLHRCQLGMKFVMFFDKLTDMIEDLFAYLEPLSEYARRSDK